MIKVRLIRAGMGFVTSVMAVALVLTGCGRESASGLNVAVASNFAGTVERIIFEFESETGIQVTLIPGSTGKHFAQITNGAPIDVYLAADTLRPSRLEINGYAVPGSRFTYAVGRLALWSPSAVSATEWGDALAQLDQKILAIANPELAPYGRAAREVLERRQLWEINQDRIVRGENITQTFHFLDSGNADMGFVAYSQLLESGVETRGSYCWCQTPSTPPSNSRLCSSATSLPLGPF